VCDEVLLIFLQVGDLGLKGVGAILGLRNPFLHRSACRRCKNEDQQSDQPKGERLLASIHGLAGVFQRRSVVGGRAHPIMV
jgi:hypothetical protein